MMGGREGRGLKRLSEEGRLAPGEFLLWGGGNKTMGFEFSPNFLANDVLTLF